MKVVIKSGSGEVPLQLEGLHYESGRPVRIFIIGGLIIDIREIPGLSGVEKNLFLAPGLIDNQVNGFADVDFSGDHLTPEGILKATEAILREGVTTFIPTLITNSHENLLRNFSILHEACKKYPLVDSCVPGFHLEGPYISPEDGFRGCHFAEFVRKPDWNEFNEYFKASGGRIIQITIAPEIQGAIEFIKRCTENGIIVALGHTNANAEQINKAVENGASLSTHLGNGCANMINRHNNPIWPQLDNDKLTATVIADGNHLLPEEIRVFLKAKGKGRMIITSDVTYLAGMPPGHYTFSGMNVILKDDGTLFNAEQNVLAGASFPLTKGVENIMRFTGASLRDAIDMASADVASIYNLKDRGQLLPGKKADIIIFSREEGKMKIKQVYKNGIQH
ncbi:MAG TPA: N-acetylglucosamine-6-phosphate deacetylase [Bacteroidales bacterium]|nr:N-acetylglucosamine-6-phosphate deacetylase [Bacteroidales bacterium]